MADLNDVGFWRGFLGSWFGNKPRLRKGEDAYPANEARSATGAVVNTESSLKLSVVWACVRLRAQTIASLPLNLRDDNKNIAKSHPLYRIIHDEPNADMCASTFWEAMVTAMDINGNAYAEIKRKRNGEVISLEYLDPERMVVKRSNTGALTYDYAVGNGEKHVYSEDQILHLIGFTLDGITGLSPLRYAADAIGFQIDANSAAASEYQNRLKAGGFLTYDKGILQEEQRKRLRTMLSEFSDPANSGKFLVLEDGMGVANSGSMKLSPADAQLLESRMFGIEEICRAFAVPPQLIGQTDKASSWASSLDQTNMAFLTYSLRPMLTRIEQTIAKKLLSPAERRLYNPKFAVDGLMRTDPTARAAFYSQMLQNGVYSRNYVRELEDLPPVSCGDDLTVQVNMTTIENLPNLGNNNEPL